MKKRFISIIMMLSLSVVPFCVSANATQGDVDVAEYYAIVEEISEEYDIEIVFTPAEHISSSPSEFRAKVEEYAQREQRAINYSAAIATGSFVGNAGSSAYSARGSTEVLSKTTDGWKIGATASYYWSSAHQRYLFSGGSSVFVEPANILLYGSRWFEMDSSSCYTSNLDRTLWVSATGTSYYSDSDGLISFPDTTYTVDFSYTALSVN